MRIGNYQLQNPVFLAPMAGITDQPFRQLCTHFGAGLTFSEMMSSNPQVWHTEKSLLRLARADNATLNAVQIVGSDPLEMAQAAQINEQYGADLIDINMGCPAKKVNRKLAGSALLQYPELVGEILHTVVKAVSVPVTLKIRTGWNKDNQNCVEIAKIAEKAGIKALTIHGRTRACLFNGKAEYDNIRKVKASVSIPVIANGDITSPKEALTVLKDTNADGIMIGRASLGNPWLFQEVVAAITNTPTQCLSLEQKIAVVLQHIRDIHRFYGEQKGYRIARKHVAWYVDNLFPNTDFKHSFNVLESASVQLKALEDFFTLQLLEPNDARTT